MAIENVKKYNSVTKTVEAIQFVFENLKNIYLFLNYSDVTYYIKDRVIAGIITDNTGKKLDVAKNDYIVKTSEGDIFVMSKSAFEKSYIAVDVVQAEKEAEQKKIADNAVKPVNAKLDKANKELEGVRAELSTALSELEQAKARATDAEARLAELGKEEKEKNDESDDADDSE